MNALLPLSVVAVALLGAWQDPPAKKPAPADPVKQRLDSSPRHHEWVDVKHGDRSVHCFVVYPESKGKVAAVLVIHENKGLTDWVRSVADQLAEAGYLAIAPDLLTGAGPKGGNTDSFESVDAATQAIYKLDGSQVTADLDAVGDHVLKDGVCNGHLSVAGFCWGGGQSFDFAAKRKGLDFACVFYGSTPKEDVIAKIACPVHGFYGESDARITGSVPETAEAMKKAGKTYDPVVYAGAGHGFMRAGEMPDASDADRKAMRDAWTRWKDLLAKGPGAKEPAAK
jgi:carboxymethylenebutenolidase